LVFTTAIGVASGVLGLRPPLDPPDPVHAHAQALGDVDGPLRRPPVQPEPGGQDLPLLGVGPYQLLGPLAVDADRSAASSRLSWRPSAA
jgi:hypothetical protein